MKYSSLRAICSRRSANELQRLVEQIAVGVGHVLERRGLIERYIENAWLASDNEADPRGRVLAARRRGHHRERALGDQAPSGQARLL